MQLVRRRAFCLCAGVARVRPDDTASGLHAVQAELGAVESLMKGLAASRGGSPLEGLVAEHLGSGGKRLRARLALAALDALGGDARRALGWAAACELFHNATLVHDDLQDGDRVRRGKPTVWVRHGMEQAINVGDLLFLLPFSAVGEVECDDAVRWHLCRAIASRGSAVIAGQAAELAMARDCVVQREAYVGTVTGKTSGLFELPVEGAALIAGYSPDLAAEVCRPFRELGLLFQMQDDVLDLYGDKGREAPGADLREGKISALVVEHLALHPNDRDELIALLQQPRDQTQQGEVETFIQRFRDGGALGAVAGRIRGLAEAVEANERLGSEPDLKHLATELIELVLAPIRHVEGIS